MNQIHPWCWLWKPGNCAFRMPSSSKGNSYFSQEPSYNLPGLTEEFKDFADSSINHCDFFSSEAAGSTSVWWTPCLLAKKETGLPSRQIMLPKVLEQRRYGSAKDALVSSVKSWGTVALRGLRPVSVARHQLPRARLPVQPPPVLRAGSLPDGAQVSYEQNLSNKQTTKLFVVVRIRMSPHWPIYLKA